MGVFSANVVSYDGMRDHISDAIKLSVIVADLNIESQIPTRIKSKHAHDKEVLISLGSQFPEIMLTEREAHCALLMLLGFTSKQTAEKICLSPRTVEHYLGMLKRKLFLKNRSAVISALLKSDFIKNMERLLYA
jgi:DNA-binding CsgD family transcriptional regulator